MDPNETIKRMRRMAVRVLTSPDERPQDAVADAIILAELFETLDEWIAKGGFLPADWSNSRPKGIDLGPLPEHRHRVRR